MLQKEIRLDYILKWILQIVNENAIVLTMLLPISNLKTVSASGLSSIFSFNLVAVQKGSGSFIEPR